MKWKLVAEIILAVVGILLIVWAVPAMIIWQLYYSKGNRSAASELSDGRIEFAPRQWIFLIWPAIAICSVYLAIERLRHMHGASLSLAFAALCAFATLEELCSFPGVIVVARDGLEQVYWLRKNKHIAWANIVEINTGAKIRTITVTGADGTEIVHSGQQADRPRLLLELKQHSGDNLPPDFPREPLQKKE